MSDTETKETPQEVQTEAPVEALAKAEENIASPDGKKNFDKKRRDNRDNKEKKPRRNMYAEWEKEITVTLDTPLPEMPKEKLAEPNNDELRTKLKDLDKEVNALRDSIAGVKEARSKAIDADRQARDEKAGNLKGLFGQVKELNVEITELNDEKKDLEADIERKLYKREQVVKGIFGKKVMKPAECEDRIADLDHQQKTEKLTAIEERAILKDLKALQNSLPLIEEAHAIDVEVREVKDKKKVLGGKMKKKIDQRNEVNVVINDVKAKQKEKMGEAGEEKVETKKEDRPLHPMTIKINEIKAAIEAARAQKQVLKDAHDKHYKDWRDQNELDAKIKWIKNQKYRLQKVKDQEVWEAEQKAEEDKIRGEKEDYERLYGKPRKYQTQIDVCENLISFLGTLKPKAHEDDAEVSKYNEADVEAKLGSGDWKKEKMHVLKKNQEEAGVQPGQKKHKKGKKSSKPEESKLTMTIETLSYFDQVKVSPPSYAKEIDGTLKQIVEKKEYFTKMSDEINDGKKPEGAEAETEKVEEEVEGGEEKKQMPEKKTKKQAVKMDDENMFPSL